MTSEIRLRLWLLGTPRLEGDGEGPAAVLSQQKRLALLAFLAVRREFVRRDDLVATIWADLDADRARRALSQALFFLRQSLGEGVIRKRGSGEVGLAGNVWCDLAEFERAIREGRLEDALELYRGELLQGADAGLSVEFSHWIEAERSRCQRLAADAASTLAMAAYRAGELDRAVRWQRRALDIRPLDEATLREHIKLLDEAGDAATALAEYDAFRTRMATEFGLDPAPETVKLIGLIRRQRPETTPVRLSDPAAPETPAPPRPVPAVPAIAGAVTSGDGRPAAFGRRAGRAMLRWSWQPMRWVAGAALILAGLAFYWVETWPRDEKGRPIEFPVERIAFLYIEPRGDTTELRYLADGLTEEIIHNLSEINGLRLISSDGVRPFRGREPPPPDTIVQRLEVNTYIRAKLSKRGGVKHLQIEIQNANHEIVLPLDYSISEANVFESIEEITRGIVDQLKPVLGSAIRFERLRKSTSSPQAWDLYAQAAALEKLLDSYVGLRDIPAMTGVVGEAEGLIAQASERDPAWSEPHLLHGRLAETVGLLCGVTNECDHVDWLEQAIGHATRAIDLDSTAAAFELRGRLYYKLAVTGGSSNDWARLYELATQDLRTATRDSRRAGPWTTLASIYIDKGEFVRAREAGEEALRKDSFLDDRLGIISNLFLAQFHLGEDEDADRWCRELQRYQPGKWPAALCSLVLMTWTNVRKPDVDSAWSLVNAAASATPVMRPTLEMLMAPLLSRAGDRQGAGLILNMPRTASIPETDTQRYKAAALTRMGLLPEAEQVLLEWIAQSPAERGHVVHERWFKPLIQSGLNVALRDAPR